MAKHSELAKALEPRLERACRDLAVAHDLLVADFSGAARADELVRQAEVMAAAGADGIAIDTNTSLQAAVESFSGKIICGGMDPAVISQGSLGDIEAMVRKTVAAVKDQPGYFFQCPGMTGRAPIQNIERYQELIREYGKR